MSDITINFCCNICSYEFAITVRPAIPAQTYGPPEHCYPAEPAEIDPCYCPRCDYELEIDPILEAASDARADQLAEAADYKNEERRDERSETPRNL